MSRPFTIPLARCPGHDIWKRDFTGSSGLFSFIHTGDDNRSAFVDRCIRRGHNWGGFESSSARLARNTGQCRVG
jgi:cystathionine beta-lyase/cystathionine gamma-synthase